jgi:hypothetical protein
VPGSHVNLENKMNPGRQSEAKALSRSPLFL